MEEMYWITRLNALHVVAGILAFVWAVFVLVLAIYEILNFQEYENEELGCFKKFRKAILWGIVPLLILIFVPTSKQVLLIYGVGSTIDYVIDNDKIQNLPEKCIEALEEWVDSLNDSKDE